MPHGGDWPVRLSSREPDPLGCAEMDRSPEPPLKTKVTTERLERQHLCLNFTFYSRIFAFPLENSESGMDDEIMTIKEVAAYLKIKEKTAYRLASESKIPGFKVGGSWRFRQKDIENWISAQSSDGGFESK